MKTRIQRAVMHLMFRLPAAAKQRMAGAAIIRDGQRLALDAQLLTVMSARTGLSLVVNDSPEQSRQALHDGRHVLAGPRTTVTTHELTIGTLPATLYTPAGADSAAPLLVYFHGGGWVIGSPATHDSLTRFLADRARVKVLSVGYRLAPEHPFPAAVDDALEAFAYAHANIATLGVDPARIAVGGDSAGANLAAVLAQVTSHTAGPQPAHQFLFYPATDFTRRHPSRELFAEGFMLTDREVDWFQHQYAGAAERTDPHLSPLLGTPGSAIAPASIWTAGFDPLRDEGESYATMLRALGAAVALHREEDLIHGYLSFFALSARFHAAAAAVAETIRAELRA
ncbi:alpha/beta hydrolase [Dactylosporangium sp. CA-233914]|uniref:alpha/beta hydrolase n=1 Tax=Dactylosporangium sp. CA-233914 TaxID=3239934 RepID=UPI003D8B6EDE